MSEPLKKILTVFGTRPEVIKLASIIAELEARSHAFRTVTVASGQHTDLLYPFVRLFGIRIDHNLNIMEEAQTPSRVCARVLDALEPILVQEQPDMILVQGDTTTALAGGLAGFYRRIPVGHVEAGMRSGNVQSPFPEEINRQVIARLATCHFASTPFNQQCLLAEGVPRERIFLTGNPVVDAVKSLLERLAISPVVRDWLKLTEGLHRIVLTTHRRESFGNGIVENLCVLRDFVVRHQDVALIFPVHPNPQVKGPATAMLGGHPRIFLAQPLNYDDFIQLLSHAWLIVSDSGGVQAEAPTLGKPLLILRENTEMPEVVESGVARLVGGNPARLAAMLEEIHADDRWVREVRQIENPLGRGESGKIIVELIAEFLGLPASARPSIAHGLLPRPPRRREAGIEPADARRAIRASG
jgi:UDP-N-acetylglucosamine 2-epimerase (non-hydrolysing)